MKGHVVGVDGGTTKTIALVADYQGRILGASRARGSNWTGADVEIPMAVVAAAVRDALSQAGLGGDDIELGMFALAGADWPEDHDRRRAVLERAHVARHTVVKNDAFAGMRSGSSRPYGLVIAAGTGTNTAIIAPDGREWAFGYYATHGGASDMAQEAIEAVLRAEDGRGPQTELTGLVLDQLNYHNVESMLRGLVAREVGHARRLSLCPLVFEAAYRGDEVATELVVKQGHALAEYATALIRRFGIAGQEFDVVLSGSLLKGRGPLLVDTITQAIHRVAPLARIVPARFEPAVGAVLLAYDALGLIADEVIYNNLAVTCPEPAFYSTVDGGDPSLDAWDRHKR